MAKPFAVAGITVHRPCHVEARRNRPGTERAVTPDNPARACAGYRVVTSGTGR